MGLLNYIKATIAPPDDVTIARSILDACKVTKRHWSDGATTITEDILGKVVSRYSLFHPEICDPVSPDRVKRLAIAAALCHMMKTRIENTIAMRRVSNALVVLLPTIFRLAEQEGLKEISYLYDQCSHFVDYEKYHLSKEEEENVRVCKWDMPLPEHDRILAVITSWFLQSLHLDNPTSYLPLGPQNRELSGFSSYLRSSWGAFYAEIELLLA